jgi:molybdopterin-guanine dinucleotide biosynthesis protein
MNQLIVNILGPPASGKTTIATSLFSLLKKKGVNVGLVVEYATMAVIEQNQMALKDQLYVWSNQQHHIFCASHHYDIVVTDSPILLGYIYNVQASPALQTVILETHYQYENLNVFVELDAARPYTMAGRIHGLTEAMGINQQILDLLAHYDIPFLRYHDYTEEEIVSLILSVVEEAE